MLTQVHIPLQSLEAVLPVEVVVIPGPQGTQFVFPSLLLYSPTLHTVHVVPSPPYPAAQTVERRKIFSFKTGTK